jgi:hypothetical protein
MRLLLVGAGASDGLPDFTLEESVDRGPTYAIRASQLCATIAKGGALADFSYMHSGQFRSTVSFTLPYMGIFCPRTIRALCGSALLHHIVRIVGGASKKQMLWPNTALSVAGMTDKQVAGDWSVRQLPRHTMRLAQVAMRSSADREDSVPNRQSPFPQPTPITLFDLRPEPFSYRQWTSKLIRHMLPSHRSIATTEVLL